MKLEHSDLRREEIISACRKLYDENNFKDITIKLISDKTTFSRPSIYNYFETKEEIFLAIFQKEYEEWTKEIDDIYISNEIMSKDEFAKALAKTIDDKKRLLKLLSMNMYDLEENSRTERLVEFKKSYKEAIDAVGKCVNKFFPEMDEEAVNQFLFSFFPFMFGIYPYAVVTEKQQHAMDKAGVIYKYYPIYELAYIGIKKLLG